VPGCSSPNNEAVIEDRYAYQPAAFSIQDLVAHDDFPRPFSGQVVYKAEQAWEMQYIFVDRAIINNIGSGGTRLLGPLPTKKVTMTYTIHLSVDAQGNILSGPSYSNFNGTKQW
jgi:hypothetical protein